MMLVNKEGCFFFIVMNVCRIRKSGMILAARKAYSVVIEAH